MLNGEKVEGLCSCSCHYSDSVGIKGTSHAVNMVDDPERFSKALAISKKLSEVEWALKHPTIFLIGDNKEFIDELREMFTMNSNFIVVGYSNNGYEAFENIQSLNPDIVITNTRAPEIDGLLLTLRVKNHCPSCKVVLYSLDNTFTQEANEVGADAYLLMDLNYTDIKSAVIQVVEGQKPNNSLL